VSLPEPAGSFADVTLSGTTSAARPELAGLVLEDVITPFSISGAGETLAGNIQNRVVRSMDGTLDFYWRILPTSGKGDISAFRVEGFAGLALDADWRSDGLGTAAPDIARYFGSDDGAVNFLFDTNEVGVVDDSSRFFFLDTQATAYAWVGQFDLLCANSGCISTPYPTFAPSAVPVPAAVWLFGSGLLGLIGIARRKADDSKT
jgi:hypothetical protein